MDGMDWMAGAMRAARTRLDVAAHNLANVSTDGFRKARADAELTARGILLRVRTTDTQGALRHTGAPFDLAIVGPGEFDAGGVKTRLGAFSPDRAGFLADAQGRRLHGERGPVFVDARTTIEADGSVRSDGRETNRIPLPHGSSLRSGFLEGPNTDAIGEMIEVLNAQRAFETAQKTLLAIDQVRERAVSDVERLK
ncbi:MAG TPA: flagellar basal body rod C-terminal domain-containing protein [Candidatus Binatia bacterium]|nr:flagellar basal body rod C-terminal domain-containing protein [Candidatus Binatia bacterium]